MADRLPTAWRRYSRDQYIEMIHGWLGRPQGRWIKTDLWEETTPSRALLDHLPGPVWTGIDISHEVASRANAPRSRVVADVRRLPFRTAAFDGALSTSTLDHFPSVDDVRASLEELRRVLAPGARLLLTLDNPSNPMIRLRNALPARVARTSGLVPFDVGVTLSERRGRDELRHAGFEVKRTGFLLHVPLIIGTRLAGFGWYARHVMPWFDRLGTTALRSLTGHYVAFLAVVPASGGTPYDSSSEAPSEAPSEAVT